MADRVLPYSLEAERSLLGAVLVDNAVFAIAAGILTQAEMFFRDAHKRIWKALVELERKSQPMDLVTLNEELQRRGDLDEVGGPAYIATLVDGVPKATNVEYYARIVREKYQLRAVISVASRAMDAAYTAADDADTVLDRLEREVMAIGAKSTTSDFVLSDDWMREVHAVIEHVHQVKHHVTGVPTGLPELDRMTRGLQPADLIYIGARPSVGKTSLMLQMVLASSDECMTGVVSVEMARIPVGLRLVAMEAKVDLFRLLTGRLSDHEQGIVGKAMERISRKRIAIDDASGLTSTQLRSKVRRLAARYGLGIVFIDYMQLLQGGQRVENRNLELAGISAGLKGLAKELNIPVVVLSQLNRDSAKGNRRPHLADLRDSGSLEQDADVVLLLHRPGQHDDGQRYGDGEQAELIVAKQRNGPTGTIKLQWLGSQVRFAEIDQHHGAAA